MRVEFWDDVEFLFTLDPNLTSCSFDAGASQKSVSRQGRLGRGATTEARIVTLRCVSGSELHWPSSLVLVTYDRKYRS